MMLATNAQYVYDLGFCLAILIVIGVNRRTTLIQTFGSYLYIFENSFSLKIYWKLGHKLNVWISQVPESCSAADVVQLDRLLYPNQIQNFDSDVVLLPSRIDPISTVFSNFAWDQKKIASTQLKRTPSKGMLRLKVINAKSQSRRILLILYIYLIWKPG